MRRRFASVLCTALLAACGLTANTDHAAEQAEDSMFVAGQALYWRGEYDSAQAVWHASLSHARQAGDSTTVARLLTWLGLSAMRTGNYAESRAFGESALALKLNGGSASELARSYNALGLLAMTEERLAEAAELFRHAMDGARTADDDEAWAAAAGNLGLISAYLGDLAEAAQVLLQMREAAAQVGNARLQGNALTNLGMVAIWAGDPQAALSYLDTARSYYHAAEHPFGEQNALGQLATAFAAMGEYDRAFAALDSALLLARRHDLRDQEAENLRLLAGLFAGAGDARRALRHYDEAAALARELELEGELGVTLRRSALLRLSLGAHDAALRDAEAALVAHRSAGEVVAEFDDLLALARIRRVMGAVQSAEHVLDTADVLAQRIDSRSARLAMALARGELAEHADDPRAALAWSDSANALLVSGDASGRVEARSLAARAFAALGMLDSAAVAGMDAVSALERVRGTMPTNELRSSLIDAAARMYGDVVLVMLQLGRTDDAFAVADGARSRELVRHLSSVKDGTVSVFHDAELLLHRIDALLSQLGSLDAVPPHERAAGAEGTASDLMRRVERLRDEYESLMVRSARADPRAAALLGTAALDASAIRSRLQPGELMLHYLLAGDELIIFALDRDRTAAFRSPARLDDLASRTRVLRELATRDAASGYGSAAAQALHETLIGPVAAGGALVGVKRLLIVPHGLIGRIPFAALRDPRSGRYLVEDYDLLHLPSAAALPALRSGEPRPAARREVHAFVPTPALLPGTRKEATAIKRGGVASRTYMRSRATEAAVRRALQQTGIVHIAAHATLNPRNPLFSRIELARAGRMARDDGRLELHEVLALQVRSSLVVLSGCETGLAAEWSSDPFRPSGVVTLSQSFLQAGAENVIATLWRIDDRGSAELLRAYYEELRSGDPVAALAGAQRRMIRSAGYSAPYYWAGFTINGSGWLTAGPQ